MAANGASYPQHPRAKVNRYRNRGTYDYNFIHSVVNEAASAHVAFPPSLANDDAADPFPALLPMIGVMGKYPEAEDYSAEDEALDLYLHGYVSSRLMRLSSNASNDSEAEGLPLTVSATLVDGIVLSLTPNSHSYNYRSAVLHGYGMPVTDQAEKVWAMEQITNKVLPQRWENSRIPPTKTEMTTTNILRVRVVSASGKERKGGPNDDRHDLKNEEMRERVWTGVVPIWEHKGAPLKAETESKEKVPEYITSEVEHDNMERRQRANEAAASRR